MKIILQGETKEFDKPTKILDMFDNSNFKYYAARVNNKLKTLDYIVDKDSTIILLDLTNDSVIKFYQATLRYVIVMAVKKLYPNGNLVLSNSVSRSIFASLTNIGHPFLQNDLEKLNKEVQSIIKANYEFRRISVDTLDAEKYFSRVEDFKKAKVLKYHKDKKIQVYECNGYLNYMFEYMLPSTGYLKDYLLRLYSPGFLISYPRSECGGKIPDFKDEKVFRNELKDAIRWANKSNSRTISDLNEIIDSGRALEFINMCEAKHNKQFVELGDKIESCINSIKLICVAGPSSSGKTTFTNRLRIELKSRGIDPIMISMDDFYKPNNEIPIGEDGKKDFEDINALDLDLFDDVLFNLIQGEEVRIPYYDFKAQKREFKAPIKLKENQVVLIEGIHGLNDMIAKSVAEECKFKIFISPMAQYNIDDYNPISITDLRLIRRIVRDHKFRGFGCEQTLSMWQSVRKGEFKWIYPFQNNADYVFNSELSYELCVTKKHAIPILEAVDKNNPDYITAERLIKFLKYFEDISDKWIPCNSILREFIGESIFYTDDKI